MRNGGEFTGGDSLVNRFSALAVSRRHGASSNNNDLSSGLNQNDDILVKTWEQEQEIVQLRKHLADYAVREVQMRNERYVLEKRIAITRMALDHNQQELINSTSKAILYRQKIIEENIRLAYAVQTAQEETTMYASSLMPLLEEFSLHPPFPDAQSIVSNLRVLFTHFKEKLTFTESNLRESQYQLGPWHSGMNLSNSAQLPETNDQHTGDQQNEKESSVYSPYSNLTHSNYAPSPVPVSLDMAGQQKEEPLVGSPSNGSPYLPSILEEPSSSFPEPEDEEDDDNEDADEEPLPGIEGLQILGEPFPGRELQASGYSTNGTTHCGFEWVRHLQDGSVNYIDGAKQPTYTVTADDIDTYLAVEVQPLDDNQRKGELVKCFANENKKITIAPEMRRHIEKTLHAGQGFYRLSLWAGSLDIWEPATLEIKREGYSIKRVGINGVVVTEKFSAATVVSIPCEIPLEFSITGSGGVQRYLRTKHRSADLSGSRDTIVLTLRFFSQRAVERKKKKKRVLFFTK